MIYQDESTFVKDLKAKKQEQVYLFYGSESYLKDLYRQKMIDQTVEPSAQEMNLHIFDGAKLDVDSLYDVMEMLPFFAPLRCVVVDGFDYEALDAASRKKFLELLKDPCASSVMVLIVRKEDFDPKKSAKAKEIIKAVDQVGAVVPLQKRQKAQMQTFIRGRLKPWNATISNDLCSYLLERCPEGMQSLASELEKLGAYATGQEVTKAHIDAVTTKAVDSSVYDLSKMVLKGNYQGAMQILHELFYLREQPLTILATLSGAFIDLYRAKIALAADKQQGDVNADFSYRGREFRVRNAFRDCRSYPVDFLRDALDVLCEADWKLKSSRAEDRVLLEQAVIQLFVLQNRYSGLR